MPFRNSHATKKKGKEYIKLAKLKDSDPEVCVGLGIKPVSKLGSQRLIRSAIQYAIDNKQKTVFAGMVREGRRTHTL